MFRLSADHESQKLIQFNATYVEPILTDYRNIKLHQVFINFTKYNYVLLYVQKSQKKKKRKLIAKIKNIFT